VGNVVEVFLQEVSCLSEDEDRPSSLQQSKVSGWYISFRDSEVLVCEHGQDSTCAMRCVRVWCWDAVWYAGDAWLLRSVCVGVGWGGLVV